MDQHEEVILWRHGSSACAEDDEDSGAKIPNKPGIISTSGCMAEMAAIKWTLLACVPF